MFQDPRKLQNVDQLDWYNYDKHPPVESVTEEQLIRTWLARLDFKTPEIENYLINRTTDWSKKLFIMVFNKIIR